MPAMATVFKLQGFKYIPQADFGPASRNVGYWSPDGKILCLGGFGNLQGEMDFWDTHTFGKVGSSQAHCATQCAWSPDGALLACATLTPRMKVENGIRLVSPTGAILMRFDVNELFEFSWRPENPAFVVAGERAKALMQRPVGTVAPAAPTPATTPPQGKYRHPNATGRATALHKEGVEEGGGVKIYGQEKPKAEAAAAPVRPPPPRGSIPGDPDIPGDPGTAPPAATGAPQRKFKGKTKKPKPAYS
eukprot:TRINITY_DN442_c0_g1_i3.p2 TRINITY_DN442_c0_g1~~TRINITY_DN442_c0_g1_i3.p2  ORF type:complete len:247 (+),score=74.82 TRINITY_DN442_c0_g1_i3:620-1360(+)